jgi:hypothetical protein
VVHFYLWYINWLIEMHSFIKKMLIVDDFHTLYPRKVLQVMLVTANLSFCLRDLYHSVGLIALEYLPSIKYKVRAIPNHCTLVLCHFQVLLS